MNTIPETRDLRSSLYTERDALAQQLYRVFGPGVMNLGFRYFGYDRSRAEELVSETFARVIAGMPYFRGQSTFKTWIFRIALNVIADWLKKESRTTTSPLDEDPSSRGAALDDLEQRERDQTVRDAYAALGPNERMVLTLIASEGLTHPEAAALLGVAEGTMWSRYARARIAFADELRKRSVTAER